MKREYGFEGTWTTIPRVRDAQTQGCDGGVLVRVHAGYWPGYLHQRAVRDIPGASRVALRAVHRMTVHGRRQDERAGQCDCAVQATPAIVQAAARATHGASSMLSLSVTVEVACH